jgi:hypothetical protein
MSANTHRRRLRFSLRTLFILVVLLSVILGCLGNLLHCYHAERRVALEIDNAGGHVETALFGLFDREDPARWDRGPRWMQRVTFAQLSGTDFNDERLTRLELHRFKHLRGLSIGYFAVFGLDGPKWEAFPPPITEKGLASLPPFPKLIGLELQDLPVGDRGFEGFARKYPCLERIAFSGTKITDTTMLEVRQLFRLERLSLRGTLVTDEGLPALANLTELGQLDLSETGVTGPGLKNLHGLSRLTVLVLNNTPLEHDAAQYLVGISSLEHLHLQGTAISDDGIRSLASLKELKSIHLQDTAVTDAAIKHLARLPRLEGMTLIGTEVTDAGLAELTESPALKRLYLERTGVTMIGVERFLRRKPGRYVAFQSEYLKVEDLPCES